MEKGEVVVSEHSSQSSRSSSHASLRSQSEEDHELPCEGDLLVVRRMLGKTQKNLLMKVKGKIFFIQDNLLITNYVH